MKYHFLYLSFCFIIFAFVGRAEANNGGVHGPIVKANTQQFDWRTSYSPSENGKSEVWVQRAHYQHAFNDRFRVRLVGQYRKRDSWEYDNAKVELLYNFNKFSEQDNFASGIRIDLRTRSGSRPDDIALHWTNQFNFDAKNYMRAILVLGKNINGTADKSTKLGTRFAYYHRLNARYQIGMELFDSYGELSNIGKYDEQSHQLGPAVMMKFGRVQVFARYLTGLTKATPDHNFAMRVIYNF